MADDGASRGGRFSLKPLEHIGAEVVGLDLDKLDEAAGEALRAAWRDHGVLLFRETTADAAAQLRLTALFGPLMEHAIPTSRGKENPLLIQLGGQGETKGTALVVDGEVRAGFLYLHQDGAYTPTITRGGMLRLVKAPRRGGDTLWVDTEKGYAALPRHLREICDTHSIIHLTRQVPKRMYGWPGSTCRTPQPHEGPDLTISRVKDFPPVVHPIVTIHPDSGQKVMILAPLTFGRLQGMTQDASDDFFEELITFLMQPRFCYRHHWVPGDMILHDNRRMLHAALGYPYEDERIVQRVDMAPPAPTGRHLTEAELAELHQSA